MRVDQSGGVTHEAPLGWGPRLPRGSWSARHFNPDRDADGAYADRVVEALESALRS
jgi:hypothetical protein